MVFLVKRRDGEKGAEGVHLINIFNYENVQLRPVSFGDTPSNNPPICMFAENQEVQMDDGLEFLWRKTNWHAKIYFIIFNQFNS